MRGSRRMAAWAVVACLLGSAPIAGAADSVLRKPLKYNFPSVRSQYDYRPAGPQTSENPWVAWSDRADNAYYLTADSLNGRQLGALGFLDRAYVVEEDGEYVRLVQDDAVVGYTLSKGAGALGFVHKSKLVFWTSALVTEAHRIPRKAVVLNTVAAMGNVDSANIVAFRAGPGESAQRTGRANGRAEMYQFYYVLKQDTANASALLSMYERLQDADRQLWVSVPGWAPTSRLVLWDHRVAVEPNWDRAAISERRAAKVPAGYFVDFGNAFNYKRGQPTDVGSVLWSYDPDERESGSLPRPPLLSVYTEDPSIFLAAVMGEVVGDSSRFSQRELIRLVAEMRERLGRSAEARSRINVIFVMDATSSMERYFPAVADGVIESIDALGRAADVTFRFGVVLYRDYAEENAGRLTEVLPLRSAGSAQEVAEFLRHADARDSLDHDYPEAMYFGLESALREIEPDPRETNLIVLIGDAGNHSVDGRGLTLDRVVIDLLTANAHYLVFQTHNDPQAVPEARESFEAFAGQNWRIIRELKERSYANDRDYFEAGVLPEPGIVERGPSLQVTSGAQLLAFHGIRNGMLDPDSLRLGVVAHVAGIRDRTVMLLHQMDSLALHMEDPSYTPSAGQSSRRAFSPDLAHLLRGEGIPIDVVTAWLRSRYQLMYYGAGTFDVDGLTHPLFRRVVLLHESEVLRIITNLDRLSSSYGLRKDLYDTWITVLGSYLGGIPGEALADSTLATAHEISMGIPLQTALRDRRLRDFLDPDAISDQDLVAYVQRLQEKSPLLKSRYDVRYEEKGYGFKPVPSGFGQFLWVEEDLLP